MKQEEVLTIFERSRAGRLSYLAPELDVPEVSLPENLQRREALDFPHLSESEVVRHYTNLSVKNFHIDRNLYPLGSCTMKYNPKVNEQIAGMAGFAKIHPLQDASQVQGALEVMVRLKELLAEITGMDAVSLQPAAGAHGELLGMMVTRQYHLSRGEQKRKRVLIPDSAHGTNPASATLVGFTVESVSTESDGKLRIERLKEKLGDDLAALMITNPNTLGLFETRIAEISELVHAAGGLMYMDGANMNAIMGKSRPGDMGFDLVHLNLHKTFSTPHGGGGPGCGPLCVVKKLAPFLPYPRAKRGSDGYSWLAEPEEGGVHQRIHGSYGNFLVMVRALAYILRNGGNGLSRASEMAVLNANYLKARLKDALTIDYPEGTLHEFVASGRGLRPLGLHTLDLAKRLLDYGYHAPTIYFPLVVEEALMIEPTETETKDTMDAFADAILSILQEARENPQLLRDAPLTTPVRRLDETKANRAPQVCWGGRCD